MPDVGIVEVELSGKRKVTINLQNVSIAEFRLAVDPKSDQDKSDAVVAKACGMTLKELQRLSHPDYRRVISAWWTAGTQPLEGYKQIVLTEDQAKEFKVEFGQIVEIVKEQIPNSQSEST